MMKRITLIACFAVAVLIVVTVAAAKGGANQDTPVTSTIQGTAPNTDATVLANRIVSDQLGSYQSGVNSVSSILQATLGDWVLDTRFSRLRRVILDFREPVAGTANTPPFGTGAVAARLISQCSGNGISYRNMNLTSVSTLQCPLHIGWMDSTGTIWGLAMNPPVYSQTNWVLVTCTAADSTGACSHWTLAPTGFNATTQQTTNIAHLFKVTTVKGKQVNEDHGDYYMAFAIDINRP